MVLCHEKEGSLPSYDAMKTSLGLNCNNAKKEHQHSLLKVVTTAPTCQYTSME
jgi:hypothetical protein